MKPTCPHCGNNPVPHTINKFYESFDILVSPIRRLLTHSVVGRSADTLSGLLALGAFKILYPLGLIQINRDFAQIKYDRARVLWQEALDRGQPIEEIKLLGKSIDLYRTKIHNQDFFFMSLPRTQRVATSNLTWVDDKYLLKKKLLSHNLPMARGGAFTNFWSAKRAFAQLDKPVIVKPRAGSRGRHTTTFVDTEADLKRAFRIAKQLCHWAVVEEHLFGDVYRGTVIGGKLVGILGASSPQVTGDGVHTIQELITAQDAVRLPRVKEIKMNPLFLAQQNLSLKTILPPGQVVTLSEKVGLNYGGITYDCTARAHPDNKWMLEEAAKILDISIVGFDFIIPDITKSWKEQKAGIIEANGAPFIQLHHDPLIGQPINAAKAVWDLILETK